MIRKNSNEHNEEKQSISYVGEFISFSEMGMEGSSYCFSDRKAKYLDGYESLDLAYFFRLKDKFVLCTVTNVKTKKEMYSGSLSFYYNHQTQSIIPLEIPFDVFLEMISQKHIVTLASEKKLFDDKIFLNSGIKEDNFIIGEMESLVNTDDSKLDDFLLKIKKEIKEIKILLKKIQKYDESKFEFKSFMKTPHSFLFGSKPLELVLRGDGEHLLKWMKSRISAL